MNITDFVIGYEEFIVQYLDAANNFDSVTRFWNAYNQNPNGLIKNHQYLLLRRRLFALLRTCKRIDADAFRKIHKGNPYYYIGIASYLMDDYQTAIYFFDAAVTEDLTFGADPLDNPKPSTRFLMLEGDASGQAAKDLTKFAQTKVERICDYYRSTLPKHKSTPQLTLEFLRSNFIYYSLMKIENAGLRTLVTALITYCIEWDFRNSHFEYGIGEGTSEPFFMHLFRGCVLFESLIKENPSIQIEENNLNSMLNNKEIRNKLQIDPIQGKGIDFTLDDLFGELSEYDHSISDAIRIAYLTRNTLGHNLGWNPNISQSQYQDLYFIIASSCLHVIASLW